MQSYIEGALRNPALVGAHWFQYLDEPTTGRFDGENYQVGFVDICDRPYPEMVAASRAIASRLYATRSGGAIPQAIRQPARKAVLQGPFPKVSVDALGRRARAISFSGLFRFIGIP